jgi:hypothetical protein
MGRQRTVGGQRPQGPEAVPLSLPAPYEALNDSPNLIDTEREDLSACEAAIDGLRIAFWAAGKALQVIRDGRLYRAEYPTFEAYCTGRWQMHRRQADRLIQAWQLAEFLSPIGLKKLNEAQVRELLPLTATKGREAAKVVYEAAIRAAAEADGVEFGAAVIKGSVDAAVPSDGEFDAEAVVREVRAYIARLADGENGTDGADGPPARTFDEAADRVRVQFRKALDRPLFRRAAKRNPEQFRRVLADLRRELDEIEQKMTAGV